MYISYCSCHYNKIHGWSNFLKEKLIFLRVSWRCFASSQCWGDLRSRNSHCQFQRCPLQIVGTRKQKKNHTIEPKVSMHFKDIFPVSHFHLSTPYLKVFTVFKLSLQSEDSGSQKCKNVEDILYSQLYFLPAPKAHDDLTMKIYSQYVIVPQCLNSINNIQNSTSKQDTNLTWNILKCMGHFHNPRYIVVTSKLPIFLGITNRL